MSKHVFIFRIRNNKDQVDKFCEDLTKNGVKIWLDRNDIAKSLFTLTFKRFH